MMQAISNHRIVRKALRLPLFVVLKGFGIEDAHETILRSRGLSCLKRAQLAGHVLKPFQKAGVLFVHIPRNGGTSVSNALYGQNITHYSAAFYRDLDASFYASVPSFAVLRDPVERFLSSYMFIKRGGGELVQLDSLWRRVYDRCSDDIDGFIEYHALIQRRFRRSNFVMRPQTGFIADTSGKIIVDRLFVLNHQNDQIEDFLGTYGVDRLKILNRGSRDAIRLTGRQIDAVRQIYSDDVALIERVLEGWTLPGAPSMHVGHGRAVAAGPGGCDEPALVTRG